MPHKDEKVRVFTYLPRDSSRLRLIKKLMLVFKIELVTRRYEGERRKGIYVAFPTRGRSQVSGRDISEVFRAANLIECKSVSQSVSQLT